MTLKDDLAASTPGPWRITNGALLRVVKATARPVVLAGIHRFGRYGGNAAAGAPEANARLIARAPDMAAALIEAEAALALHQAWSDSEDAGPDYGGQTRDTHPDGERIWRQWWDGNLSLCDRAQEATKGALAHIREVMG